MSTPVWPNYPNALRTHGFAATIGRRPKRPFNNVTWIIKKLISGPTEFSVSTVCSKSLPGHIHPR